MYEEIFKALSYAKQSRKREDIHEALRVLVNKLTEAVGGQVDYTTFADFIYDPHFLFSSEQNAVMDGVVDVVQTTNGLIAQLLEIYGAVDFEKTADELKGALSDLHSVLSRNLADARVEKIKSIDALDSISVIIS